VIATVFMVRGSFDGLVPWAFSLPAHPGPLGLAAHLEAA